MKNREYVKIDKKVKTYNWGQYKNPILKYDYSEHHPSVTVKRLTKEELEEYLKRTDNK